MNFIFKEQIKEEVSQAKARIAYAVFVMLYFAVLYQFPETGIADNYVFMQSMIFGVFLYAAALLFYLQRNIKFSPLRQCFTIIVDLGTTSYVMYLLGSWGAVFYPLYLWVISGNGLRFGTSYLWYAMVIGFIGFSAVISFNPYWVNNLQTGIGLLIGVIVLPSFFAGIIKRLYLLNASLQETLLATEHEATHDPLTGLCNRAKFEERFEEEAARADRNGLKFSILFLDLDRFKSVNDLNGHKVGDLLLQSVAQRLKAEIRTIDMAIRLGGDEFAIITMSESKSDQIDQLPDRLAKSIAKKHVIQQWTLEITASIGLAYYPDDGKDIETLMHVADERMYRQKNTVSR